MCSPNGVMQVSLEALHSHAEKPGTMKEIYLDDLNFAIVVDFFRINLVLVKTIKTRQVCNLFQGLWNDWILD